MGLITDLVILKVLTDEEKPCKHTKREDNYSWISGLITLIFIIGFWWSMGHPV